MRALETGRIAAKLLGVLAFSLSGCVVVVQPALSTKATPAPDSAYLAGVFSRNEGTNFGFRFVNTQTQEDFVLAFGSAESVRKANAADLNLIAVPPGEYRIERWVTFGRVEALGRGHARAAKLVDPTSRLGTPFRVEAGQILHVGATTATYTVERTALWTRLTWNLDPVPLAYPDAVAGVARKYPAFAGLLVICPFCDAATGPQQPGLGTYDPVRLEAGIGEARAAAAALQAFWAPRWAQLEMKSKEDLGLKARLEKEYEAERDRLAKPFLDHVDELAEELRLETKLAKIVSKDAEVWTGVDVTDELVKRYEARWPSPDAPAPWTPPAFDPLRGPTLR